MNTALALCIAQLLALGTPTFGDLADLFVRGRTAPLSEKTYRLIGIGTHAKSPLGWGNHFDPAGHDVNGVVPKIRFATRKSIEVTGEHESLLSFASAGYFLVREDWGVKGGTLPPEPLFVPSHWTHTGEAIRESLTTHFPLFAGNELFLGPRAGGGDWEERAYLHCREIEETLICAVWVSQNETSGPGAIANFLVFAPSPS